MSDSYSDFSMMELFRLEVETHTQSLSDGLLKLETAEPDDAVIETLMRAAHSIKGAARIVRLAPVVDLAHAMEDAFEQIRKQPDRLTRTFIDRMLQCTDQLRALCSINADELEERVGVTQKEFETSISRLQEAMHNAEAKDEPGSNAPSGTSPEEEIVSKGQEPEPETKTEPVSETASSSRSTQQRSGGSVRVGSDTLNRLMDLTGEAIVQSRWLRPFSDQLLNFRRDQYRLQHQIEQLRWDVLENRSCKQLVQQIDELIRHAERQRQRSEKQYTDFEDYARRAVTLNSQLYQETISSRMRPFQDGIHGFPRLVRDLGYQLGKQVSLEIRGKETRVDRDILDALEAPLTQIIRNALDHGFETPDERTASGKPPTGTLVLEANHHAGKLQIAIHDDGRGVNIESIRNKVIDRKLADREMAALMAPDELIEFLFLPGFTTRDTVTELSGRGVGLDVVRSMVQTVHGTVLGEANPRGGFTIRFRLPQTLSVLRCLILSLNNEPYALPLARIDRIVRFSQDELVYMEGKQFIHQDDQAIGLVSARQILELPGEPDLPEEWTAVILSHSGKTYGLVVDEVVGEFNVVVRPLDPRLGKVPDVSAVGIMRDGGLSIVLDAEDLFRSIDALLTQNRLKAIWTEEEHAQAHQARRVLIVDDSLTVREVERRLLEYHGYEVDVAVDGMDGLNALRKSRYHLVISDIDMPRMNGFELVRHIRSDPSLRSLPVMIVSYKDREEDRMKGLESGANYYLTKSSFHDETLLDAVVDLIGKATE